MRYLASSAARAAPAVVLAVVLAASTVWAQPAAPPAPVPPPATDFPEIATTPFNRVVPMNEARTIGFFTALFPDCSVEGPVVARLLTKPEHGTVTLSQGSSFPRYAASSPLAPCNSRKVEGLRMVFEAAEGYEGLDRFSVLVIYPNGTATNLDVKVSIR
ncbi:hypothetical protein [Methylobacterium nodulans]|uniref:Uncharacterized protein n=1 Tax=Methylobacterium nodulans (strain LMG 21967 / CNCM I-2342 / ORS 2060) TaxID=460265 RepID=B8IF66_METNO|nr:hypothetical protein [Methylobacterium nodulans]ACL55777.1 hypothetical protein Mnod_0745 [Methylobacterium nodulans ORS 2060]